MNKKLKYGRTFLIGLAFMSISSFGQVYDNIIPLILKNTFTGSCIDAGSDTQQTASWWLLWQRS